MVTNIGSVKDTIIAKNEELEGDEVDKNKEYQGPRSRNNTNGSSGSFMSKISSFLLLDSQSTFNGDIVYDDIEDRGNAFMKKDHDSSFGMRSSTGDGSNDDDEKGNDSSNGRKKGSGSHTHHRSLSGLFSESASISGNLGNLNQKPPAIKNGNDDKNGVLQPGFENKSYPCQQLRSSVDEQTNEDDSTTGKKHRRMYSGGVSNPSMAHRRINSGGNAAFINRHSSMSTATTSSTSATTQYSNTSYNPSHNHHHQPIPIHQNYQHNDSFYNHNNQQQRRNRPRSLSPVGSPKYNLKHTSRRQHCRDDSDINFLRMSSIADGGPVAAAKWLENMRRSPPFDTSSVHFRDHYTASSASSIPPTMTTAGGHTATAYHHHDSNSNLYPPPSRFSGNNIGSASNSRSSSPSLFYPNATYYRYDYGGGKVPSPPESTYQPVPTSHHPQLYSSHHQQQQRQHQQPSQTYLGSEHLPGQGSRPSAFHRNYPPKTSSSPPEFPYYPSQAQRPLPPANASTSMRSSCSSSSGTSSPSQPYPIQQSVPLPSYYAAAHAAARETTLGLPHHPLATEQPSRQRTMPNRDSSIKSIESKIETDEPLFQKDGVSASSINTTQVASQSVSSSGGFNRGSGGYPPIPRPASNQPHYRISPQLFEESLKEHSNCAESSPNSLTFNSSYQESLLSSLVNHNTSSSLQPDQPKLHDNSHHNSHHKLSSNSSAELLHPFVRNIDKQQPQQVVEPNSSQHERTNSTGSLLLVNNSLFGEKFLEPDTNRMASSPTGASVVMKTEKVSGPSSLPYPIKDQHESNTTLKSVTLSSKPQLKSETKQTNIDNVSQSTEVKTATPSTTSTRRKISGGVSKRVRRKCSVAECTNRVVQGGLCIAHGAKRKLCGFPGCKKHVKKAGMCSTHGPARKRCEVEGCPKVAVQGGKCIAHGAKKKLCSVDACKKQAILSGMCKKHHDQEKLRKETGLDQFSVGQNGPTCTYCIPTKENEGNSPEIAVNGVNANHHVIETASSAQHRRGLSIFQDMSTVNTIIGVPTSAGHNETAPSLSRRPATISREREGSHGPPSHKRGLSIFNDEEVVDKIVQNKFGI